MPVGISPSVRQINEVEDGAEVGAGKFCVRAVEAMQPPESYEQKTGNSPRALFSAL